MRSLRAARLLCCKIFEQAQALLQTPSFMYVICNLDDFFMYKPTSPQGALVLFKVSKWVGLPGEFTGQRSTFLWRIVCFLFAKWHESFFVCEQKDPRRTQSRQPRAKTERPIFLGESHVQSFDR
jgi:hypothetical protein